MRKLTILFSLLILSVTAYCQVARKFLDDIQNKPPFKDIQDSVQLHNVIIEEATKKKGLLNFWEHFDEKSMDGYELEDSVYTSSRGIPSYLWGKALALLGIESLSSVLVLYEKAKGYPPSTLHLRYIESGFTKGKHRK